MAGKDLLLQDAYLSATGQLPAGATTVQSLLIDTGNGPKGQFDPRVEFVLATPALTTTQAPSSAVINYQIFTAPNSDGSSAVPLYTVPTSPYGSVGVATSGAIPTNFTFRCPFSINRFLGFFATGSSSTLASSATATLYAVA